MRAAERRELLAAVLAAGLAQTLLLLILLPVLQAGRLTDIDGYSRLVRVQELRQTGAWYDSVDPRANAPFGVTSHWTRPLDALLLAGATLLLPFAEFERALYDWGVVLSPLLYLLTAAVLVWATRPVLEPRARLLMLLAFPAQFVMLMDSAPGMADHHALLLLILAATLGATLRALPPTQPACALVAGALLALGLWISTEFVLAIGLCSAALGLGWVLHGGHRAARNAWHALGLSAGITLALLLERAPRDLPALEADRISILHLLPCLAALGLWTLLAATGLGARLGTRRGRALAAALAALPIGALLLWLARVGQAAFARMDDPHVAPFFAMQYLEPLLPVDLGTTATFLVCLGTAVCAAPFLAARAWRTARTEAGEAWLLLALLGLGQLVAALRIGRLAGHAELLMLVPVGALLSALLARLETRPAGASRAALGAAVAAGLLLGPLAVGAALIRWSPPPAERVNPFRPSDLSALYPLLAARPGLGAAPLTILALPGDGPELLYRTPHRIVASPQHRGRDGIRDCLLFLDTADEAVARRIALERQVDLAIVPLDESWEAALPIRERSFISRCLAGDCPDWLRPLDTGPATGVRLFSVVRDAQSGRR